MKTIVLLFLPLLSFSQLKKEDLIIGISNTDTYLGKEFPTNCNLEITEILKPQTSLLVYGYLNCEANNKGFYKIIYNHNIYFANEKEITLLPEHEKNVKSLDSLTSIKMKEKALEFSMILQKDIENKADEYLIKAKTDGILIKTASVFDESEYTNGTGFKITFANPSKKTIKYIWFTVSGINRVDDLVGTKTLKGVGPLETNQIADFSYDYVWLNDLVEYFKIPSIKIQYMDGTFKTIQNAHKLIIPETYQNLIFKDED